MAYSRRQIAQAQQLYKIASDAAYTHRAATHALRKLASDGDSKEPLVSSYPGSISGSTNEGLGAFLGSNLAYPNDPGDSDEEKALIKKLLRAPKISDKTTASNIASLVSEPNDYRRTTGGELVGYNDTNVSKDPTKGILDAILSSSSAKSMAGLLGKAKAISGSKFDSLQGEKVPAFLKNLTKGQAAGGAAALAALLGGGAYLMNRNSKEQQQAEAAEAIMAAKNLSEAQRRRLLRNLGIGAGAALGGYGLYRALR